jgi:hypothetical protein
MGSNTNKVVVVWIYDDANDTSIGAGGDVDDGTTIVRMAFHTGVSPAYYVYKIGTSSWGVTNIPRTTGWHQFVWDYSSGEDVKLYIDGTQVGSTTLITSFNRIRIGDMWADNLTGTTYYDDVSVQDTLPWLPTPSDTTAPTVADGTITSDVTQTGVTLSWNKATDDTSAQSALQYLVYQLDDPINYPDFSTVDGIEANGTAIGDYASDITSITMDITELAAGTTYYFNVIVKDEAGNKNCYTTRA